MEEKKKKPIYKRWWFIGIIAIIVIGVIFGGGDESKESGGKDNEIELSVDSQNKSKESEEVEDTKSKEYVNTAEETELFTGEFIVGEDITQGRYEVTSGSGMGNFFVYEGEVPIVNEILSTDATMGVTKLRIDLEDKQRIQISGIDKVIFKPAEIKLDKTLVSGNHLVGRDVPAGTYIAKATSGSGNFFVYSGSMPVVNEILGDLDFGVDKIKVKLKDGQMVIISGIETVELTE